jgi:hypothetical protein
VTPAGRERRWDVSLRLAIEAASEAEAQAITSQVLSRMRRELPLQGEPVITPLPARDGLWDAALRPTRPSWRVLSPTMRLTAAAT